MHFNKIEVFLYQLYLTQSVELQNNDIRQAILNEISNYYLIDIMNQDKMTIYNATYYESFSTENRC